MIAPQSYRMSDPLRSDGSRAHADVASGADRDAKIEQLLLVGLDHYFAARYEQAINVWTRALFLDRSHARARAYIERARSALAERQRESEELLQNGVGGLPTRRGRRGAPAPAGRNRGRGAVRRGARRARSAEPARAGGAPYAGAAIGSGASATARLTSLEPARARSATSASCAGLVAAAVAVAGLAAAATWNDWTAWRSVGAFAGVARRRARPCRDLGAGDARHRAAPASTRRDGAASGACLAAGGRLREALSTLDAVRPTDSETAKPIGSAPTSSGNCSR